MSKRRSITGGRRGWSIVRVALVWARKGNKLVISLNVLHRGIKKLGQMGRDQRPQAGALVYGDRQFSFDDTPVIRVRMHRPSSLRFKMPHIPCISTPHVDFDYDFELDHDGGGMFDGADRAMARTSLVNREREEEVSEDCDDGIDSKAEQFIAKFYEQMRLQRQISYLQYSEKESS